MVPFIALAVVAGAAPHINEELGAASSVTFCASAIMKDDAFFDFDIELAGEVAAHWARRARLSTWFEEQ
jgi:hypothetical protein